MNKDLFDLLNDLMKARETAKALDLPKIMNELQKQIEKVADFIRLDRLDKEIDEETARAKARAKR